MLMRLLAALLIAIVAMPAAAPACAPPAAEAHRGQQHDAPDPAAPVHLCIGCVPPSSLSPAPLAAPLSFGVPLAFGIAPALALRGRTAPETPPPRAEG